MYGMKYLIETQSQLSELQPTFEQLYQQPGYVAVDTEFLREKTYHAKLCLVQLGIGNDQYCIDVLAINNLTVLSELLADTRVVKVFHAARQDMEVLYQTFSALPKSIFDTQLAAAFCGMDMQLGYAALVEHHLDIKLAKSQARTNWSRRPLSDEQLSYAADDVAYLGSLYEAALIQLEKQDKLDWYQQELLTHYDISRYDAEPSNAYRRLFGGGLNIIQQYTLKALAEWRESIAQDSNIPRTWVLRDDRLFELAMHRPMTESAVQKLNVFGKKSARRWAFSITKVISQVEIGEKPIWKAIEPLDKKAKGICSVMMQELARCAQEHQVAQGLLATRKDIEALYRRQTSKKLFNGWRQPLLEHRLLDLMGSKIT